MTTPDSYDVAVIGYGPTGATAANLLGQLGLKVLVVERDPDVYGRARAISTDEEVMRIWQSVGLAERLQQDMLPDRPLNFVDAGGVPFIELKITPHGGHPPQQFLYQPAVDHVLRKGSSGFPTSTCWWSTNACACCRRATGRADAGRSAHRHVQALAARM